MDIPLPAPLSHYRRAAGIINPADSYSIHEADFLERTGLMGQALRDKLTTGSMIRAGDVIAAHRMRRHLARATDALFGLCDLLLLPGAYRVAPSYADPAAVIAFTREGAMNIASLSGHPAMTTPCGFDGEGMPLNVQIIGPYFAEARVLRAAQVIEDALAERARRPTLRGGDLPLEPSPPVDRAARDDELARNLAAMAAELPRLPDKFAEPAGVFRP